MFVLYLRNFLHQISLCDDFPLFYDLTGHDSHFVMPRLRRGCYFTQADFGKSLICTLFTCFKLFLQFWRFIESYFTLFVRRCYLCICIWRFITVREWLELIASCIMWLFILMYILSGIYICKLMHIYSLYSKLRCLRSIPHQFILLQPRRVLVHHYITQYGSASAPSFSILCTQH